jgi:ABC-type phosphate transport system substrate-binding protein
MSTNVLFLVLAAALAPPAAPADVQIIANRDIAITELSAGELKDIFLGNKTAIGGTPVEPVFEEAGGAHQAFLKTYLGKSASALRNHFKTLVFTGKGAQPKAFGSDGEVVRYVARTKGAIGYVSGGADLDGVKKLHVR